MYYCVHAYIRRLWKEKCFKFGIYEPQLSTKRKTLGFSNNPWKQVCMCEGGYVLYRDTN